MPVKTVKKTTPANNESVTKKSEKKPTAAAPTASPPTEVAKTAELASETAAVAAPTESPLAEASTSETVLETISTVETTTETTVEATSEVSESSTPTTTETVPSENFVIDAEQSQQTELKDQTNTDLEKQETAAALTVADSIEPSTTTQSSPSTVESQPAQADRTPSESLAAPTTEKSKPSPSKSLSVKFSSTDDEIQLPQSRVNNSVKTRYTSSSYKSSYKPVDFIDALVESYKLETSNPDTLNREENKYVPKTSRSRLNPNWREHRTRRLMNKLEELSLWDREEEMKAAQAQSLREQKWEQIQDRQRNHDLCLSLMRQRHESEMESAVLLDRGASSVNDENKNATIARTMKLATPVYGLDYEFQSPPSTLKRRSKKDKEEENDAGPKTPIGRYRQFENQMNDKIDKINQKLQPDHEIMRAYNPNRTSIPTGTVPLFSETYSALLSVPDPSPSNKYNQYHYGVASYLHQPIHAPSPDYETRLRSYATRDVRVPLKEQTTDYNYYDDEVSSRYPRATSIDDDYSNKYRSNLGDDDYYPSKHRAYLVEDEYPSKYRLSLGDDDYYPSRQRPTLLDDEYSSKYRSTSIDEDNIGKYRQPGSSSRLGYSPPRRTTSLASPTASALYDYSTVTNTPRDYSFLHSRPPTSNSIHQRSLNDDLNAITRFSSETSKKIIQSLGDSSSGSSGKGRSTAASTTKHVSFNDYNDDDDSNLHSTHQSRSYASKSMYEPVEILSLSSTR